jgi:crotonobetaine/carnitine-CoA ligase
VESIGDFLTRKAEKNKGKPYLYFQEEVVSYESINGCANQMANTFLSLGISKGDHVTVMLPNCPEYLYCWFGLAKIGAVIVAINTQYMGERLKNLIEASNSKWVLISPEFLPQYEAIKHKIKGVDTVVMQDELFRKSSASPPPDIQAIEDIEPLIISFTSGTTGLPKLVRNSHRAYITAARDLASCYLEISEEDRIYSSLPLYHANPQVYCVLTALAADASIVVAPRFSASRFWDDVRKYRATAFSYVGAILPILLAQPERSDDRDVPATKCLGGGAPKEVYKAVTRRFGVEVHELYGMSETGTFNTINRPGKGKAGTVGQVREGFDVRIFDDKDNELRLGEVGEIVIRPTKPYIMFDGYYKSPEETVESSSNWWFHTGDLGKTDEQGYYYFCGRKKESIRRGGENISPYDIENAINAHPFVAECAAFGIADPIMEEEIGVAVVLKPSRTLNHEEIVAWCEPRLPKFLIPRYIEFMKKLPKSASEKVQKGVLKERGPTPATWDRQKPSKA